MLSMTGYGNGQCCRYGKKIAVMASAVNRKQIDLRISLPRELMFLEQDYRERITRDIHRGAITVLVDLSEEADEPMQAQLNLPLAKSTWENLKTLRNELGIEDAPRLSDLLAIPEIFSLGSPAIPEDELRDMAMAALEPAVIGVMKTRQIEGETLAQDLTTRTTRLDEILVDIEKLAPRVPELYRKRLEARINEFEGNVQIDEDRLIKEVLFFADRCDITEETTRLASHLEQLRKLYEGKGPIGRKLDFLIQELGREINTIGSKASDKDIALLVVEFKAELERIREQVQNIE